MKRALFCFLVLILCIWFVPFMRCEVLTMKYGNDEFLRLCNECFSTMVGECDTLKVLAYRDMEFCRVYCRNRTCGLIFELKYDPSRIQMKTDKTELSPSGWYVSEWDLRWSDEGSASEIVYPYIFDIFPSLFT